MVKLRNVSIGKRLGFGFGTVVLIALALGITGILGISRLSNDLEYITTNRISDLRSLAGLNYQRMAIRAETLGVVITEDKSNRDEELRKILERRKKASDRIDEHWNALLSVPRHTEKGRQLVEILKVQYQSWRKIHGDIDRLVEEILRSQSVDRKNTLFQELKAQVYRSIPISDVMGSTFDDLTRNNNEQTDLLVEGDLKRAGMMEMFSLLAMIVGVFIALVMTVKISRSIVLPIASAVSFLSRLREGELRENVPQEFLMRKDEIGTLAQAVQDLTEELREQIASMKEVTVALASSAYQISASVSEVTAGAEETAVAVVETTATMEEVRTTAEVTNRKSKEVAESAQQGLQVVQKGKSATDALFDGMKNVGERMTSIAETIIRLSEQSQEVGEITETVEDLAEQSNLLAVNAAVEAAKAGEQGRGFSVVAQEIKSLAEQSKQSAKEVQRILRDIQKATSAAVMAIEQGSKAVEQGAKDAAPSRESIQGITKKFVESAQSAAQIAAANNELLAGIDQVTQAMESIKAAGEQNVAGMKDLEAASGGLKEMGQKLSLLIERYTV